MQQSGYGMKKLIKLLMGLRLLPAAEGPLLFPHVHRFVREFTVLRKKTEREPNVEVSSGLKLVRCRHCMAWHLLPHFTLALTQLCCRRDTSCLPASSLGCGTACQSSGSGTMTALWGRC